MDIHQSELLKWLRGLVGHLLNTRGMTIAALMRCKFLLAKKIENKIAAIRQKERSSVYQQYLFESEANTTVSFDTAFTFADNMYWDQRHYRGRWKPRKHFLGPDRVPAFDGADDGEEMRCAQVIDSPGNSEVLDSQCSAPSQFVLAPHRNGQILPGLCRLAKRRSSPRRRIQRRTYRRRIGYRRKANHWRIVGTVERGQRPVHHRRASGRWERCAAAVAGENRRLLT